MPTCDETVVTALRQFSYVALDAPNAEKALRIWRSTEHIDLLFADVMMPGGMLGPELARRARARAAAGNRRCCSRRATPAKTAC